MRRTFSISYATRPKRGTVVPQWKFQKLTTETNCKAPIYGAFSCRYHPTPLCYTSGARVGTSGHRLRCAGATSGRGHCGGVLPRLRRRRPRAAAVGALAPLSFGPTLPPHCALQNPSAPRLRRRAFGRAVGAAAPRGRARIFCALRPRFARVASLPRGLWLAPLWGPRPFFAPLRPYAPRKFVFPLAGPLAKRAPSAFRSRLAVAVAGARGAPPAVVPVALARPRPRGSPCPPTRKAPANRGESGRGYAAVFVRAPARAPLRVGLPAPSLPLARPRLRRSRGPPLRFGGRGRLPAKPLAAFPLGLPRYAWHPPLSRGDGTPRSIGGPWWAGCATLLPRATLVGPLKKLPLAVRRARYARPSPRG